jgi:hypothetical protein
MHFHRDGCFALRTVRKRRFRTRFFLVLRVQFPIDIFQQVRSVCEQPDVADGVAETAYLFTQVGLVTGKVVGQLIDLNHDHCGKTEGDEESRANRAHHRQRPGDFEALQHPNERRQHETEQNRQGDRNEDFTRKVKDGDYKGANHHSRERKAGGYNHLWLPSARDARDPNGNGHQKVPPPLHNENPHSFSLSCDSEFLKNL